MIQMDASRLNCFYLVNTNGSDFYFYLLWVMLNFLLPPRLIGIQSYMKHLEDGTHLYVLHETWLKCMENPPATRRASLTVTTEDSSERQCGPEKAPACTPLERRFLLFPI